MQEERDKLCVIITMLISRLFRSEKITLLAEGKKTLCNKPWIRWQASVANFALDSTTALCIIIACVSLNAIEVMNNAHTEQLVDKGELCVCSEQGHYRTIISIRNCTENCSDFFFIILFVAFSANNGSKQSLFLNSIVVQIFFMSRQ